MYLIDQDYLPIKEVNNSDNEVLYWSFDPDSDQPDFYLNTVNIWFAYTTEAYNIRWSGGEFTVPANYYITIGDIEGGLDTVKPEEVVGRDFDLFMFNRDLEPGSWTLEPFVITGYVEKFQFIFPHTNNPVPIIANDKKCMLVSGSDCYKKIRDLNFLDIA